LVKSLHVTIGEQYSSWKYSFGSCTAYDGSKILSTKILFYRPLYNLPTSYSIIASGL